MALSEFFERRPRIAGGQSLIADQFVPSPIELVQAALKPVLGVGFGLGHLIVGFFLFPCFGLGLLARLLSLALGRLPPLVELRQIGFALLRLPLGPMGPGKMPGSQELGIAIARGVEVALVVLQGEQLIPQLPIGQHFEQPAAPFGGGGLAEGGMPRQLEHVPAQVDGLGHAAGMVEVLDQPAAIVHEQIRFVRQHPRAIEVSIVDPQSRFLLPGAVGIARWLSE